MPLTEAASVVVAHLGSEDLPDDRLVEQARAGDASAIDVLLHRYTPYTRSKARTYFLMGADREDIIQEGMIGLFKAIRDFDVDKAMSFRSFAELCITRQIITAIKAATRRKHVPLNSYVSLHRPVASEEDGERQLADFLASARTIDPVELVVADDEVSQIRLFLSTILSDLEAEVLQMYLAGSSYQTIAAKLERHAKSIDNALQRIKRKLEAFLKERERTSIEHEEQRTRVVHVSRFAADESNRLAYRDPEVAVRAAARVLEKPVRRVTQRSGAKGRQTAAMKTKLAAAKRRTAPKSRDLRAGLRFAVAAAVSARGEQSRRKRA